MVANVLINFLAFPQSCRISNSGQHAQIQGRKKGKERPAISSLFYLEG